MHFIIFKILFIYSWETQKEAETQAEGEAGSLGGARCGTQFQDPRITSWAKGRCSTAEPPRCPQKCILIQNVYVFITDADIGLGLFGE